MQAPAHFGNPLPARLATAPACTAAQAATHQRRAARPQTHTLLMTRHPNHPNRPTMTVTHPTSTPSVHNNTSGHALTCRNGFSTRIHASHSAGCSGPRPVRVATASACTAAQAATHQRSAARPQTHILLMTRHPKHPNRPPNDRRTPDQHTAGTQQHVRSDSITEATQRTKRRTNETHS